MATDSSNFARKTSQTKENLGGYRPWGLKESDLTAHVRVPHGTKRGAFHAGVLSLAFRSKRRVTVLCFPLLLLKCL